MLSSAVDPIQELARTRLGVFYLYPVQRFVISNTLEGKSQIVVLPTGAGKSLCFQLPSLLLPRATLVLVPLLSLMADQLRKLREAGVSIGVLRGGLSPQKKRDLFAHVKNGKISILLATPEACRVESNLAQLRACRFSHLVVDEAHCISEWGETFRPVYREIGALARGMGVALRTAFTATASEAVIVRIKELLFDDGEVRLVTAPSDRPNIFYSVRRILSLEHELEDEVRRATRPLVTFFRTRNGAEVAARAMRRRVGDERLRFYHAGLSREERADVERWFLGCDDGVLFATCAYGLGVDKPDIRTVVHAGVPGSVEAYLQETGRAGRDGQRCSAILLVSREDRAFAAGLVDGPGRQRYESILGYALSCGVCRRQALLELIGAGPVACSGCDVCAGIDIASPAGEGEIAAFVRRSPRRFSIQQAAEILSASAGPRAMRRFHDCITGYGTLAGWDKGDAEAAIHELIVRGAVVVVARGPWKRTLIH
ncbi:MAG TPA: RecQ family ATP-dependent DNA helicase, partial [Spirochaetia bacterium]|nr:RecQ family ATP-dependent DNA helicase [Spirochaetia bacterium]